jgi:hypothetical protein
MAGAALAAGAGTAVAYTPHVETWTNHVEVGFIDCPDFATIGTWDIRHKLTLFVDASGTPTRDIEQIDFVGRITNAETGAWVADSGARTFFDTLAPDGSFLTTYMVSLRQGYLHGAGRDDFQTGSFSGLDAFSDANLAALCEALGG